MFGERDPGYRHLRYFSLVSGPKNVPAPGAQVTFDIDAVLLEKPRTQRVRDQVQWLLLHWAPFDCVNSSAVGTGIALQCLFDQGHDGRLPACRRTQQQQYSLADFNRRAEDSKYRTICANVGSWPKISPSNRAYTGSLLPIGLLPRPRSPKNQLVRKPRYRWVIGNRPEVVGKGTFPAPG